MGEIMTYYSNIFLYLLCGLLGAAAGRCCAWYWQRASADFAVEDIITSRRQTVLMQVLLAVLFILCAGYSCSAAELLFLWLFCCLLVLQSILDYHYQLLADELTLLLGLAGLVYSGLFADLASSLLGGAAGLGILLLVYLASRGGMGFGDVKLAAALGLWLGSGKVFTGLLLAFVLGGLTGTALLLMQAKDRQSAIAFGPFLCIGAACALFYGDVLLKWYWRFF